MYVWQQWAYLAMAVFGAIATIAMIGKPRDRMTPGMAIWIILWGAAWVLVVFSIPVDAG